MNTTTTPAGLTLLWLLAACASAPEQARPGLKDPKIEQMLADRKAEKERIEARFKDPVRVRMDIDMTIDAYFKAMAEGRSPTNVKRVEALERVLRQKTLQNFDMLLLDASNGEDRGRRGIALAALGFAEEPTDIKARADDAVKKRTRNYKEAALNPLVTALTDPDDHIVNAALVGLGLLSSQNTPTRSIGTILENSKNSLPIRTQAAWALLNMQPKLIEEKRQRILPIWIRTLSQPIGEVEPKILVQALKGLGLFRRPQDAAITVPYLDHPTPLVRIAACVALARENNQDTWEKLLKLIEPSETHANVRLFARKALQALAGGKDRKYDVQAWRQLFTRS